MVGAQAGAFNDTLKCADRNWFIPVDRDNHLTAIGMSPFLVTAFLANLHESVPPQDANDLFGGANREAFAHVSATSNTFAPADSLTGVGSNHSSNASFALRTASSSVSPAEAQPGSSGKYAAQRFVSRSCSTTSRNFMIELYPMRSGRQTPKPSQECVFKRQRLGSG
jgi:hypothetical protein